MSGDIVVNRLICGGCLDFKLMMTVPLEDFGPWEAKGFEPEGAFLEMITGIEGVSQVETQTITNMVVSCCCSCCCSCCNLLCFALI